MKMLDNAVEHVAKWTTDQKARDRVIKLLEGVSVDCKSAVTVWQNYLANPGKTGSELSFMSWTGPEIAKELLEINLEARGKCMEIADIAGTSAGAGLDDGPIEMVYRALVPNETATDAAKSAVKTLEQRTQHMQDLIKQIRTTKPSKKPVAAAAKKKSASGKKATRPKTVKKKTTKKKAAAKKKAAKKKVVKKKAAKKKVTKKKPAKKAVKKKPAKKKAPKKKAAKKKVTKKKTGKKKAGRK